MKRSTPKKTSDSSDFSQQRKRDRRFATTEVQDVPVVILHETPPEVSSPLVSPTTTPAAPLGQPVPHFSAKGRQGLQVYALNELERLEQAMRSLGADVRQSRVTLHWLPDTADRRGREGLQLVAVADLGGRLFTVQPDQRDPAAAELTALQAQALQAGDRIAVTPQDWAQVDAWRNFGGEPLRWVQQIEGSSFSWLPWVLITVTTFSSGLWWLGIAWIFGSMYLFSDDRVRDYRSGYFENRGAAPPFREWLWHTLRSPTAANLVPGALAPVTKPVPTVSSAPGQAEVRTEASAAPTATPAASTPSGGGSDALTSRLPDDLAAGLQMVRDRVADLPEEDVITAEGYRLRGLAERCEEAARLYLRLPAGSAAAATAAAEVRAMLEDSLQSLSQAGSRSQQQQEETLRAIQNLRQSSVPSSDPLRLD
ncbi:hypothetical protein [Deinococcus sp. Marseille-Q6407]|uniref:hypothetical protein n=1 Tax=Deinococcus sp. Marseille-Q6407 TaxID=2969223 RepID=UPI0021BE443C|nr:hypothetical protein [Deinococcus sp. Marseille-Q6407]